MKIDLSGKCDASRLSLLLADDDGSRAYRELAAHVETCNQCQQQLTNLAADASTWKDVGALLSVSDVQEFARTNRNGSTMRNRAEAEGAELDRTLDHLSLEFLAAPSHPEMLGRLGRYEIERTVGSGGMGVVLKGFDTELNRPVAIKVLAAHLAHSGAARQRFAREARAAAAVVHEHVVAIHNVETDGKNPFLVMQYVAGESLQARVERDGPLSSKETLRIGIQAAAGLAAAHEQGLVHRDVKPANILLESGIERALLTDFGLARTVDDASLTHTGIVAGTPHYMSPEQAEGEATDARTDLFSLGATLYFAATGHAPFRAERAMGVLHRICHDRHRPAGEVNDEIDDELSEVIDRLLEKKPSRRYATAAEAKAALTAALARLQRTGGRRKRKSLRQFIRRRRLPLAAATVCMSVAACIWSYAAWYAHANRPHDFAHAPQAVSSVRADLAREVPLASSEAFFGSLDEIASQLDRLEADWRGSAFSAEPSRAWHETLDELRTHLDELQSPENSISESPAKGTEP